jgi:DNA-binding NtrC family response regulator
VADYLKVTLQTSLFLHTKYITVNNSINIDNRNGIVLIIDDEPDICFMLSSILKKKALASASVHTIREAGTYLQIKIPSLVFLDNNLPDGRGIDFLCGIKKEHPEVKVVMITAYDTYSDKTDAFRKGADAFIGKPFTRQNIYDSIERLLH